MHGNALTDETIVDSSIADLERLLDDHDRKAREDERALQEQRRQAHAEVDARFDALVERQRSSNEWVRMSLNRPIENFKLARKLNQGLGEHYRTLDDYARDEGEAPQLAAKYYRTLNKGGTEYQRFRDRALKQLEKEVGQHWTEPELRQAIVDKIAESIRNKRKKFDSL